MTDIIIPFISKWSSECKFIGFEAVRYFSDKYDIKAHEQIKNTNVETGFEQWRWTTHSMRHKWSFKKKKTNSKNVHLPFCSLSKAGFCNSNLVLLCNLKVPNKKHPAVVQTHKNFWKIDEKIALMSPEHYFA